MSDNLPKYDIVEYPGLVKNGKKGLTQLNFNHFSINNSIELRFNNNNNNNNSSSNQSSKPIKSDYRQIKGFLCRVDTTIDKINNKHLYATKIVGKVSSISSFNSLCDFQPIISDNKIDITNLVSETFKTNPDRIDLPPPNFSSLTKPFEYKFAGPAVHLQPYTDGMIPRQALLEAAPRNRGTVIPEERSVFYDAEYVPTYVIENLPEWYVEILNKNISLKERIDKIFDDRPIWIKALLLKSFAETEINTVLEILRYSSYSFLSGPWKNCIIKLNYDPRIEPSACSLQVINIRLDAKQLEEFGTKLETEADNVKKFDIVAFMKHLKQKMCNDYALLSPPSLVSNIYQLCDIAFDGFQEVLNNTIISDVCTKETGWYSLDSLKIFRKLIQSQLDTWRKNPKYKISTRRKNSKKTTTTITTTIPIPNSSVQNIPLFFSNNNTALKSASLPTIADLYQHIFPLNDLELTEPNEEDELANYENLDEMVTFDYDD